VKCARSRDFTDSGGSWAASVTACANSLVSNPYGRQAPAVVEAGTRLRAGDGTAYGLTTATAGIPLSVHLSAALKAGQKQVDKVGK
jgi:hypothetical protein